MGKRKEKVEKPKGGQMQESSVPATKQSTAVGAPLTPDQVIAPHIGRDEFIASKILALQSMSKKVKDKTNEAKEGELRDTIENKIFGEMGKPFEFLPIHMISFWVVYDVTAGGQGKYLETMELNATNENLKREEVIGQQRIKRVKTYECYVLIPSEMKAGNSFPYVLSFRVSSARGGKVLLSQMYVRNREAGKMPYANVCELSLTEESNDKGSFYVQHTKPKRAATPEEYAQAEKWYKLITSGQVKKDDSDLTEGGDEAMAAADTDQF